MNIDQNKEEHVRQLLRDAFSMCEQPEDWHVPKEDIASLREELTLMPQEALSWFLRQILIDFMDANEDKARDLHDIEYVVLVLIVDKSFDVEGFKPLPKE